MPGDLFGGIVYRPGSSLSLARSLAAPSCDIIADPARPRSSRGGPFLRRIFYLAYVIRNLRDRILHRAARPRDAPGSRCPRPPSARALSYRPSFSLFLSAISPVRIARSNSHFYGSPTRDRVSIFRVSLHALLSSPLSLSLSLSLFAFPTECFDRRKCTLLET